MKVVAASVVVEMLASDLDPDVIGDDELAAPHLIDSEVTHVLRGLVLRGALTAQEGTRAMDGFLRLGLVRFPAVSLRPRMWELRDNLTGYDATYVALAEAVDAVLLTTDARLSKAPGLRCAIRVL